MAQRTEKEETEFKVPEAALTHCVNNCGLTGNPATNNMCQKCFTATSNSAAPPPPSTTSSASSPVFKFSGEKIARSSSSATFRFDASDVTTSRKASAATSTAESGGARFDDSSSSLSSTRRVVNRCSGCRRKVGLTGFRCRCGELFCSEHRYSDRHVCSYDYKAAGREVIARENPVVKAAKIVREERDRVFIVILQIATGKSVGKVGGYVGPTGDMLGGGGGYFFYFIASDDESGEKLISRESVDRVE